MADREPAAVPTLWIAWDIGVGGRHRYAVSTIGLRGILVIALADKSFVGVKPKVLVLADGKDAVPTIWIAWAVGG